MSADLWSAFGGGSEDLADNPWARPSSPKTENPPQSKTIHPTPTVRPISKDLPLPLANGPSVESQIQVPWADNDTLPVLPAKYSAPSVSAIGAFSPWESDNRNEWSDIPQANTKFVPWPSTGSSAAVGNIPHTPDLEEAEFGDFEEPDIKGSMQNLKIDNSAPGRTKRGPSQLNDIARAKEGSRPSHRKTRSYQDSDPYSDLDAFAKSRTAIKHSRTIESPIPTRPASTSRRAPLIENLDLDVPYTNEEWGEFSPNPIPSTEPNVRKPSVPKSIDRIVAQSTQHSRSRSEPPSTIEPAKKPQTPKPTQPTSNLPPTNVPPPSILISLISSLIQKLPAQIDAALQRAPTTATTTSTTNPLEKALRGCLASLRVAARIIAGRKSRWKRDTHLAQSMRIGPSAAGGKAGGMKLAGVDRAELAREDREAAEFIRTWKGNLGSIRAALASVNGQVMAGGPLVLPEIGEGMRVRVLKGQEGGVVAVGGRCCVLCGLKREERVEKVDGEVLDAFGEWWAEAWGHAECQTFWREHERFLQQR